MRRPVCATRRSVLSSRAVEEGDAEAAAKAARLAYKKLDMAAAKGIIHKNQAANRKSKVAKKVNSIAQ